MSRYSGPQRGFKGTHGPTKGIAAMTRELKREEAEARNADYRKKQNVEHSSDSDQPDSEVAED